MSDSGKQDLDINSPSVFARFYGTEVRIQSLVPVLIEALSNGNKIGSATGFFFKKNNQSYLVSNWHVFSGRNRLTGQPNNCFGATPDRLDIHIHKSLTGTPDSKQVEFNIVSTILEKNGTTVWLQHEKGQEVDVACVKIDNIEIMGEIVYLNTGNSADENAFRVSSDVYIVGFPEKFPLRAKLPIWKRGTIASEVFLKNGVSSDFLIDASSRRGMSGSPVYHIRESNVFLGSDKQLKVNEGGVYPIGIYSGRVSSSDKLAGEIGIVWPLGFIEEIVDNPFPGSYLLRRLK